MIRYKHIEELLSETIVNKKIDGREHKRAVNILCCRLSFNFEHNYQRDEIPMEFQLNEG